MWTDWTYIQDKSMVPEQPVVYIGCMTGTSVDAQADFTAAVFDDTGKPIIYYNQSVTLPVELQKKLLTLSEVAASHLTIQARSEAQAQLTRFLASAYQHIIEASGLSAYPRERIVLSPHGQTINHQPLADPAYTDILVTGEYLAHFTGCRVVTRHRQAPLTVSMAAPLAPVLIKRLFYSTTQSTLLLNGGGIANLCVLPPGEPNKLIAYDIGPANAPMDALVLYALEQAPQKIIPAHLLEDIAQYRCDFKGRWASCGKIIPALFKRLMSHEYFERPLKQKSADRAMFNLEWVFGKDKPPEFTEPSAWADLLATVAEVIIQQIVTSILNSLPQDQSGDLSPRLIVYGGLASNEYIISRIKQLLVERRDFTLTPMRALHYDPDFFESLLFAYLGYCAVNRRAIDLSYCARDKLDGSRDQANAIPGVVAFPV